MWKYIDQFKDPLILLLLGSSVLSVLVRQYDDALSIAAAVIIVGTVAFIQEYRSEKSLEALKTLVPPRCNVIRGGQTINVVAEELVPGDIIRLSSGDRVPADARLISSTDLSVDESSLTGEPEPREKSAATLNDLPDDAGITEKTNIVFTGSLVCSGNGVAIVFGTALNTEFGKTYQEMKDVETRRTPLQIKMDELGQRLSVFSIGIIVCIGLLGMFQGKSFMSMFNIGVSLAVAAIPEGLPICVTVTLALGVMRMVSKNAIVKKLPSVEALGCANYICTDKTGTLTQNRMTVIQLYCPAMDDVGIIGGDSTLQATTVSDMASAPSTVFLRGKNLETLLVPIQQLLDIGNLCNNAHIVDSTIMGQPTEGALLLAAKKLGVSDRRTSLKRVSETPFSSENKYMEVQYVDAHGVKVISLKGALEVVLPMCVNFTSLTGDLVPLTVAAADRLTQHGVEMAYHGLRVIAIAAGNTINQYTLCGIVGLMDPLREGVVEAVRRIQSTGTRVMMISGDSEITAVSIAKSAGILYDTSDLKGRILSGRDIDDLSRQEDGLRSVIEQVSVCYRTLPRHKLSIIRSLQSLGHVVAMTGDGVNVSPSSTYSRI